MALSTTTRFDKRRTGETIISLEKANINFKVKGSLAWVHAGCYLLETPIPIALFSAKNH